jgi:uncharacterized membrane protein YphA (DoxX/SURF4 family)
MDRASGGKAWKIVMILCRLGLGITFIVAAISKLWPLPGFPWSIASVKTSLAMFAMGVDSYQILPAWAVSPLAHFLPFFEIVLGIWLLSGIALRFSSSLSILALCTFIYAMFSAWHRGLAINCGCFSQGGAPIGLWDMIRDGLIFMPIALILLIGSFKTNRKPQSPGFADGIPVA